MARAYSELRIYRMHLYRVLTSLEHGGHPGATSSVVKLFWSEMAQRMHDVSMAMLGPASVAEPSRRQRNFVYYRACTIFAGTSEIQRNTLGEQMLGLPREPRRASPRPDGERAAPAPVPPTPAPPTPAPAGQEDPR